MVSREMYEVASVFQQREDGPIVVTAFDPGFELLWSGSSGGGLQGSLCPNLDTYSVWRAHVRPIVGILTTSLGPLSASADGLQLCAHGGFPIFSYRESAADVLCCEWERPGSNRVLLGHSNGPISVFDLASGKTVSECAGGHGVKVISGNGRVLACGSVQGDIALWDARSMQEESSISAHQGGLAMLAVKNDLLVSCGMSLHRGVPVCEPFVRVFDLRQSGRLLSQLSFPPGPSLLSFLPNFSSLLLVAAQSGAVLITDVQAQAAQLGSSGDAGFQAFHVDCEGDALTSCHVAPSGEMVTFGDTGGYVHLWTSREAPRVNMYSGSLPVVEPPGRPARRHMAEKDSPTVIPSFSHSVADAEPLSHVELGLAVRVGLPARVLSRSLPANIKQVEFVGYVENPAWRRGLAYSEAMQRTFHLRNARQCAQLLAGTAALRGPSGVEAASEGDGDGEAAGPAARLPKGYRRVEMRVSGGVKFEEFDFRYYNRSRHAGLENEAANSYVNPLLQILFFTPALRRALAAHVCEREFCLSCELGFTMHMMGMEQPGNTCQPRNLVRTLGQIREAVALGLVEGYTQEPGSGISSSPAPAPAVSGSSSGPSTAPGSTGHPHSASQGGPLSLRLQNLARFVMEQLHKESIPAHATGAGAAAAQTSVADKLFGMTVRISSKCHSQSEAVLAERHAFFLDLQYPTGGAGSPSFAAVLRHSLKRSEDMRAWCQHCRAYQQVTQTREACSLPPVLALNCCVTGERELELYSSTRQEAGTETALPWLPLQMRVTLGAGASLDVKSIWDTGPQPDPALSASLPGSTFELTAVIALVHAAPADPLAASDSSQAPYQGHLVAHVKVPPPYQQQWDGQEEEEPPLGGSKAGAGEWLLFNDFCVTPTTVEEVVTFYGGLKVPCQLYFTRSPAEALPETLAPPRPQSPISDSFFRDLLLESHRRQQQQAGAAQTCWPLDLPLEMPAQGMLLGIDAEFVSLGAPEMGRRSDGSEFVARPARLSLARVSVVRGEGPRAGVCCLDDYIRAIEPVHDYLTRYSGLSPGDLDEGLSRHHLTSVKKVYLKLRFMIDMGCRFVGHGLKQDFRMINVVVPKDQVIDTVELFYLKRRRKLSLRFLASYLLQMDIQRGTHDSIEDARTALLLYGKYRELVANGELDEKLREMYDHGQQVGWEIGNSNLKAMETTGPLEFRTETR